MPYHVTHSSGLAASVDQASNPNGLTLAHALAHASYLLMQGKSDVAIQDGDGHLVKGADLVACCNGEKKLTADLKAISN